MRKKLFVLVPIIACGLTLGFFAVKSFNQTTSEDPSITATEVTPVSPPLTLEQRFPYVLPPRSTLSAELRKLDVTSQDIHAIVIAAEPHRNLAQLRPGTRFQMTQNETTAELTGLTFWFNPRETLKLNKTDGAWTAESVVKPVHTKVVTFKGLVKTSLWESAQEANMNPQLIAELAEIFAWQVDFAREVRDGDRWRLSVEQEFIDNEPIGWGSILSAEYINSGETFTAILFRNGEENLGYFAPDGSSLRRMFLKTPIQYGRISSTFQKRRFHPVLKTARPHLGVDYAAPTGTPIRAVGDGRITFAAWSGGGGNVIKLRHNSVYTTAYKHLSRFGKGIRSGVQVKQGQTIGYVGSTGLSTGPHLHFEFFVNGRYVDPLRQKFPSADPVPNILLTAFTQSKDSFLAYLPEWEPKEVSWHTSDNTAIE